ncbi:2-oxoglutarate dehydrogenase, E1 component [Reticulomyxa filosa]|uniref:2-oxoglutarate dehydrogenase, E1 component n=1 Tax=Reticulomyxa filosa TaxID=46433 RepID=X6P606_RETFI|nr:2-oxoglutarate dehydrogenase, E1 component [Reticulomyxa filosa]|eukprot:ETO33553.1 2-oxoglutarate dehydrogenase, E1 component [Reticulomyxa filosa]
MIVFTPKFGLRHPLAASKLSDFCGKSKFQRLIPDDGAGLPKGLAADDKVRRVLFCSGKIWIHLMDHRVKVSAKEPQKLNDVVFVRLEQVSPFPYDLVQEQLKKYRNAEFVWVQEEPKNMGAWTYVSPRFTTAAKGITNKLPRLISRKSAAAPATGYPQIDKKEQTEIVESCFV